MFSKNSLYSTSQPNLLPLISSLPQIHPAPATLSPVSTEKRSEIPGTINQILKDIYYHVKAGQGEPVREKEGKESETVPAPTVRKLSYSFIT